jgi:antitoxin component of RelBE/YafQ-DinJ toxin-antitoxin module
MASLTVFLAHPSPSGGTCDTITYMTRRHGPPKRFPDRKNVTLRCSAEVWERAQRVVAMMPGVSMSDVVEDSLDRLATSLEPLVAQFEGMTDRDEALAAIDAWFAAVVGQGVLEFSRESAEFRTKKEEKGKG